MPLISILEGEIVNIKNCVCTLLNSSELHHSCRFNFNRVLRQRLQCADGVLRRPSWFKNPVHTSWLHRAPSLYLAAAGDLQISSWKCEVQKQAEKVTLGRRLLESKTALAEKSERVHCFSCALALLNSEIIQLKSSRKKVKVIKACSSSLTGEHAACYNGMKNSWWESGLFSARLCAPCGLIESEADAVCISLSLSRRRSVAASR